MSLDHTPLAARRERKARAAKRRQEQLAAAAAAAAVAAAPQFHTVAPPMLARQRQPRTTVLNFHTMPLDTARVLDLSDVSISSVQSSQNDPVNKDIQFLNKTQMYMSQQGAYAASPLTDEIPHYDPNNPSRLQLQPPLVPPRGVHPQNPVRRPHGPPWGQQCHHSVPDRRVSRPGRTFPVPLDRTGSTLGPDARPREMASIDSALEQPLETLCASLGAKREPLEASAVSNRCSLPADLAPLFMNGDPSRESGFIKQQMQPCNQKLSVPLVSVFEDSSPVSLLSAVPAALDPLFVSCNFDAPQSLRSF